MKRVIFYGVSDEMEVAFATLQGTDMELVVIVDDDDGMKGKTIFGEKTKDPNEIDSLKADAILITSILEQKRIFEALKKVRNQPKVFTIS